MTPEKSTQTGVGRDRVRVGQPEMEGHDRALDQEARDDEDEGDHDQPVGPGPGDVPADLGHVQRAGAPVDEGDARQRQVSADAVGDGEVQRALERPAFFRPVGGQGIGRHAHELEPDEQVEDVAGEAEADHARQEGQHERRGSRWPPARSNARKRSWLRPRGRRPGRPARRSAARRRSRCRWRSRGTGGSRRTSRPRPREPCGPRSPPAWPRPRRRSGSRPRPGPAACRGAAVQRRYRRRHQQRHDGGQSRQRIHGGRLSP